MSFCDHCEGQRFDRAQVLRTLREARRKAASARNCSAAEALASAIEAVRRLEIPHLETLEEMLEGESIH